jgi:hypothetical protein
VVDYFLTLHQIVDVKDDSSPARNHSADANLPGLARMGGARSIPHGVEKLA